MSRSDRLRIRTGEGPRLITRLRLAALALVAVVAFVVGATSVDVHLASSEPRSPATASVTITPNESLTTVPRSYFGVSTEYWSLPLYAQRMALFEHVLSQLQVPGGGPLVVRVGGDSADHAVWDPRVRRLPRWAFSLTPAWLRLAGRLVHRLGVRLIFDLNLLTVSPAAAAGWARAAEAALPRRSIVAFEVGNEPDIYSRSFWIAMTSGPLLDGRLLPAAITPANYLTDFRAYAQAIRRVAPTVPLMGPAVANPRAHTSWIAALTASRPAGLGTVTAHRYPYSACAPRRSPAFPTVSRLLSRHATVDMAKSLEPAVILSRRAGLRFRLTELNSITCSGRPGVSDTFATALWAPAALFDLLQAGVGGVNVHIRASAINGPFAFSANGLTARPYLYGLILFAKTLGPQAKLVALHLRAAASLHLRAWAVSVSGQALHVLLINDGRRAVRVRLALPTTGPAWLKRLLAPSARSRSGVTLDGQQLARDGSWVGRPAGQTVASTRRGYLLTVPRLSAALLGARLYPGSLGS